MLHVQPCKSQVLPFLSAIIVRTFDWEDAVVKTVYSYVQWNNRLFKLVDRSQGCVYGTASESAALTLIVVKDTKRRASLRLAASLVQRSPRSPVRVH